MYIVIDQELPFDFYNDTVGFVNRYNFLDWLGKLSAEVDFAYCFNFDAAWATVIVLNFYVLDYEGEIVFKNAEHRTVIDIDQFQRAKFGLICV